MGPNYFCTPPNENTAGCDESELGEELKKKKRNIPLENYEWNLDLSTMDESAAKRFCVRGRHTKVSE